jgi:hypothetical protein
MNLVISIKLIKAFEPNDKNENFFIFFHNQFMAKWERRRSMNGRENEKILKSSL